MSDLVGTQIGFLMYRLIYNTILLTTEKNSRAWFIVATFFQLNRFMRAILDGFRFWSGPASRKNVGNRDLSDRIGDDDP